MLRYLCFARWKLVHIGTFSARFNWKKHAEARVFLTMRHQDLSCAGWEPPSKEQTWRKNALAQKFGTFSVEASFSYSYLDSLSACSSIAIFLFWRNWMPNAYGKLEKQPTYNFSSLVAMFLCRKVQKEARMSSWVGSGLFQGRGLRVLMSAYHVPVLRR
jgi:hypothetical protein